jgi:hypothetical protein
VSGDLLGFRAVGRHGALGVVVPSPHEVGDDSSEIVVRGGVSQALLFFLPPERVRAVSSDDGTVVFDVDLADFVPNLREDGWVELRISSR